MATFLLGDCLELMRSLPDKSVDCFICDLPWGCLSGRAIGAAAEAKKCYSGDGMGCPWDVKIDLAAFWVEIKRLCKDTHTPVLMFCNTKFGNDLINSNPSWFRYDLVWDKGHGVSFLSANKMPMKSHEMVYVFSKAGAYYKRIDITGDFKKYKTGSGISRQYGQDVRRPDKEGGDGVRCPLSVIPVAGKAARNGHPTQKPEELYRWLLSRYCPAGGTVLDPTAGSFNACFVARELGLKTIGMEKDRGFFYKAVARLLAVRQNVIEHV